MPHCSVACVNGMTREEKLSLLCRWIMKFGVATCKTWAAYYVGRRHRPSRIQHSAADRFQALYMYWFVLCGNCYIDFSRKARSL